MSTLFAVSLEGANGVSPRGEKSEGSMAIRREGGLPAGKGVA